MVCDLFVAPCGFYVSSIKFSNHSLFLEMKVINVLMLRYDTTKHTAKLSVFMLVLLADIFTHGQDSIVKYCV